MTHASPSRPPLKVAAFRDTRAGHVKQTTGLVRALGDLTPVVVADCHVVNRALKRAGDWVRYPAWLAGLGVGRFSCDMAGLAPPFDLVVGTGSATHLPMLYFARRYGGRVVTCMTPDLGLARHMDLVIVPAHDRPGPGPNIFVTTGPPNTARPEGAHDPGKGLILVGGQDPGTHVWESGRIVSMVHEIVKSEPDVSWTVSSSPRTPAATEQALAELSASNALFCPFSGTGPGWVEQAYARSRVVWVTADSISMIFEALSSGCRVGVLPVSWKRPDSKLARAVDGLVEQNRVLAYEAWQAGERDRPAPEPLDEAGRAAREILRRWWPDRLR